MRTWVRSYPATPRVSLVQVYRSHFAFGDFGSAVTLHNYRQRYGDDPRDTERLHVLSL